MPAPQFKDSWFSSSRGWAAPSLQAADSWRHFDKLCEGCPERDPVLSEQPRVEGIHGDLLPLPLLPSPIRCTLPGSNRGSGPTEILKLKNPFKKLLLLSTPLNSSSSGSPQTQFCRPAYRVLLDVASLCFLGLYALHRIENVEQGSIFRY